MLDQFTQEEKDAFFSKMIQLSSIYKTAKHVILLAEYYNSKQGIVVSSINELRGCLDHIMRSLLDKTKHEKELFKAEGHLYRAIYDACEVIIIDRLQYIENYKNTVDSYSLELAYPQYFTDILPFISQVKSDIVDTRETIVTQERVDRYVGNITKLIDICNTLDALTIQIDSKERNLSFIFPVVLGAWAMTFVILNTILDNYLFLKIFLSLFVPLFLMFLFYIARKRRNRSNKNDNGNS